MEGAETVTFRLCNCSSTLVSPERGLEGTLADLRWKAMVVMEVLKLLFAGNRREGKLLLLLLQWFLSGLVFPLYITRAGEAVEHEPADNTNHSHL